MSVLRISEHDSNSLLNSFTNNGLYFEQQQEHNPSLLHKLNLLFKWKLPLKTLFLPEDYPHSVTPDYLNFQIWDSIQALCSYLRGMLCNITN